MKPLSLREELGLFFNRDAAAIATNIISGIALGAAASAVATSGLLPMFGVMAGIAGFHLFAQNSIHYYRKEVLLDLYRDETSAVLGGQKRGRDLTVADIEKAAAPQEEGGKGVVAFKKALELFGEKRNYGLMIQLVTMGVMAGLLGGTIGFADDWLKGTALVTVITSSSALLYNGMNKLVEGISNIVSDVDTKSTITEKVREISDQIGLGGRVSSTRVFEVFVEANPELQKNIIEKFGDDYHILTIAKKRQAVEMFDSQYKIYELTQDINFGNVNPTELAFLAYGQHSGVPRGTDKPVPFEGLDENNIIIGPEKKRYATLAPAEEATCGKGIECVKVKEDTTHQDRVRLGRGSESLQIH